MAELEAKLIEEETALRVKQAIEKRVQEVMASDVVQQQLQQHLHTERQRLEKQVCHTHSVASRAALVISAPVQQTAAGVAVFHTVKTAGWQGTRAYPNSGLHMLPGNCESACAGINVLRLSEPGAQQEVICHCMHAQ